MVILCVYLRVLFSRINPDNKKVPLHDVPVSKKKKKIDYEKELYCKQYNNVGFNTQLQ